VPCLGENGWYTFRFRCKSEQASSRVAAGDLVVADDTGVCFIPRDVVLEVLDAAEQKAKAEAVRCKAIDDGVPVPDIARATYGQK
jgi:4-hydroxy-4-methyl-2-oxoglutarate aldolase